jgi:glycosyltransferase involved in cell wall biosynthesis
MLVSVKLLLLSDWVLTLKISATIITLNEARNIRAACESISWADEILVVDSGSADQTRQIADACGARVLENSWPGFAEQKQFAADCAQHEWIFSLDADERVSDELRASIVELRSKSDGALADGYFISRRAFYMGRWIQGGGWYPDRQLRLYRKSRGCWQGAYVHESVRMETGTRIARLKGDLLHYPCEDPSDHQQMIRERYAPLGARKMYEEGRRTSRFQITTIGPATFIRNFILRGGFRDGLAGFTIAKFAAHHAFLKHLLLWELQNGPGREKS